MKLLEVLVLHEVLQRIGSVVPLFLVVYITKDYARSTAGGELTESNQTYLKHLKSSVSTTAESVASPLGCLSVCSRSTVHSAL